MGIRLMKIQLEGLQKKFLPTYDCAIRETSHLSHRGGSRIKIPDENRYRLPCFNERRMLIRW